MKAKVYWMVQHMKGRWQMAPLRLRIWWLKQRVNCLEWRLRLEVPVPLAQADPPPPARREGYGHSGYPSGTESGARAVL